MMSSDRTRGAGERTWLATGLRAVGLSVLATLGFALRDRVADALDVLAAADPFALAVAFLFYLAGLFAAALRASIWLRAWGMPSARSALFGDVLAATTLNAITVSGLGEGYRIHALARRGAGTLDAALAVFGDRLLGLAVFAIAAGVGLAWSGAAWIGIELPGIAVVPLAAVGVGVLALACIKLPTLRARLVDRLRARRMPRASLVAIAALSVVTLVAWVVSVLGLARALGLDVPMDAVAASAPLVAVAAFLPVTIGGIGVREAGYVLLLAPAGLSTAGGIALGLAQYACFLGVAVLGGAVLATRSIGGRDATSGSESQAATRPARGSASQPGVRPARGPSIR